MFFVCAQITNKYNHAVVRELEIKPIADVMGFCCDISKLLSKVVSVHLKEIERYNKTNVPYCTFVPSTLEVKLTMDGRRIGNKKSVVLSLVPMNLSTFNPQNRESNFVICIWSGDEHEITKVAATLRPQIDSLRTSGLTLGERHFNCRFIWVSDLAALQSITRNLKALLKFCPYCIQVIDNVFGCTKQNGRCGIYRLGHLLGIHHNDVIVCVLHLIERVTEYLLLRSIHNDCGEIEDRLRALPSFSTFKMNEEFDEGNPDQIWNTKLCLSGRQCSMLITNHRRVFHDRPEGLLEIWNEWKCIYNVLIQDFLSLKETVDQDACTFSKFNDQVNNFMKLCHTRFVSSRRTSHYIHILAHHVPDKVERLFKRKQSLISYSNQGLESSHSLDSFIDDRHISTSTNRSVSSDDNIFNTLLGNRSGLCQSDWIQWSQKYNILQLFLYKCRIIEMSATLDDATWTRPPERVTHQYLTKIENQREILSDVAYDDYPDSGDEGDVDDIETMDGTQFQSNVTHVTSIGTEETNIDSYIDELYDSFIF